MTIFLIINDHRCSWNLELKCRNPPDSLPFINQFKAVCFRFRYRLQIYTPCLPPRHSLSTCWGHSGRALPFPSHPLQCSFIQCIPSLYLYPVFQVNSKVVFLVLQRESESHSVMSDSLQPHGLCPWNSPGQNSGVGGGFFTSWATREVQEYWSG